MSDKLQLSALTGTPFIRSSYNRNNKETDKEPDEKNTWKTTG